MGIATRVEPVAIELKDGRVWNLIRGQTGRFYESLLGYGGHLLDPKTVEVMIAVHRHGVPDVTLVGMRIPWGLGVQVAGGLTGGVGRRAFGHNGMASSRGIADLSGRDVYNAMDYLDATVTMAAVAREVGVNVIVNMSQMTVSQMSIQNTTPSRQQRQHWLSEQALAWSGLPVVTIRPTMFLESFFPLAGPTVRDRGRIELPFGRGKTNPVAAADVARMVAAVLADPGPHLGRIYELTGPRSQDMHGVAREYSDALNREVTYSDIPPEDWERELKRAKLPEHLTRHLVTMAQLNRAGRYDRLVAGVERLTGRPAMSVREFVSLHADEFGGRRS